MNHMKTSHFRAVIPICLIFVLAIILPARASRADLREIRKKGVLRHLGVPYANFVTGSEDGLDVELLKLFARHLGVSYKYVEPHGQARGTT